MSIQSFFQRLFADDRYIKHLEEEVQHLRQELSYAQGRIEKLELTYTQPVLSRAAARPQTELSNASTEERPTSTATFAGGWSRYLNAHLQSMEQAKDKGN